MPVATKDVVPEIAIVEFVGVTVIDCNFVAGVTINVADPDLLTSIVDVAVIVAVPPATFPLSAVATPSVTFATDGAFDCHDSRLLGIIELVPSE